MFYEHLCIKAKEYNPNEPSSKPLDQCDFSVGGAETGKLIQELMKKGSSEKWQSLLKKMTGKSMFSGESLIRYFSPLYKFLKNKNEETGEKIGWD